MLSRLVTRIFFMGGLLLGFRAGDRAALLAAGAQPCVCPTVPYRARRAGTCGRFLPPDPQSPRRRSVAHGRPHPPGTVCRPTRHGRPFASSMPPPSPTACPLFTLRGNPFDPRNEVPREPTRFLAGRRRRS